MSTLAGDFWVCGTCRSINNAGANQCYNCRAPRDVAEVDPATIDAPAPTTAAETVAVPEFRSSRPIALLASILILAVVGMQIVYTLVWSNAYLAGTAPGVDAQRFVDTVGVLTLGIGALALIAWALWLSRAVTAMPALGLGTPSTTGMMAFIWSIVPVANLVQVPPIVRDVIVRLGPDTKRSGALIAAAWVGLIVGFVGPWLAWFLLFGGGSALPASAAQSQLLLQVIGTGLVLASATVLVALIWWVEARIQRWRSAQLGEIDAATPAGDKTAERAARPVSVETNGLDALATRSAFEAGGTSAATVMASGSSGNGVGSSNGRGPSPARVPVAAAIGVAAGAAAAGSASAESQDPGPTGMPAAAIATTVAVDRASDPAPASVPAAPPAPDVVVAPTIEEPGVAEAVAATAEPVAATAEPVADAPAVAEAPAMPAPLSEPVEEAVSAPPVEPAAKPPHLTITIGSHGMMTAELDGDTEHVILDDLTAYGSALAKVNGTASIAVKTGDSMAELVARRAQRILEDVGVHIATD
jgi:hypothetical protein